MLAYTNLLRFTSDPISKTTAILAGVKPFFAIQFHQKVIKAVERYRLKTLISRARRTSPPREWCNHLLPHIKLAWAGESIATPFAFEDWMRLLVRFQLDSTLPFSDWPPLLNHLSAFDIRSSTDLSALPRADFYSIAVPLRMSTVYRNYGRHPSIPL